MRELYSKLIDLYNFFVILKATFTFILIIIMSIPKTLTIIERELKIKLYEGNDLLEVLGISQARGRGFNTIIQNIANKNPEWTLVNVMNYALANRTDNSNEELFLLTEYLSHRSLKNGYMMDVISKLFNRNGQRR
ncbi:MAG: hypothetical protein NVS1B13_09170 [Flavisolibacter sp.]